MSRKIVVLDGYTLNPGDLAWGALESLGQITVHERTPADQVAERIGDAQVVLTNKAVIDAKVIEACPNLEYVGVMATGRDQCTGIFERFGGPACLRPAARTGQPRWGARRGGP